MARDPVAADVADVAAAAVAAAAVAAVAAAVAVGGWRTGTGARVADGKVLPGRALETAWGGSWLDGEGARQEMWWSRQTCELWRRRQAPRT